MTLTKADILEEVSDRLKFSKKQTDKVVETLLEILKEELASGKDVMVSRFGKFCVREKAERKGRNPASGEAMVLPSRRVVTFKPSGLLRDRMNGS